MDSLTGIVERITYINEQTGYTVAKIKSKGFHDLVAIVGNMPSVNVGAVVNLMGEWRYDSKYGRQFVVYSFKESVPATIAGIEKYLGSGLIKGIGPVNAKRIVRYFKEQTIEVIERQPERLIEVEGIGPKRVEMIKSAWQQQREVKNVMLFLQSHGVSTAYAVKIYKTYGNESIKIVKENPYRLADDIWGIGFKTADKIAQNLGLVKEDFHRCRAGVLYVLKELSNDGHCYATRQELLDCAVKILDVAEGHIKLAIDKMLEEQSIISDYDGLLFLPAFYHSELGSAKRIRDILFTPTGLEVGKIEEIISRLHKDSSIKYDNKQIEAIKTAITSKFMVLTGGPGTGKTTTTIGVINAFNSLGASILLAAPTGRAAKRLSETTGLEAKTIHRLLEYKPPNGYNKNEDNPLDCDVLIIDEFSMVDIILFYNLLKAIKNETIVILIGDVDQLPSVGPGNILSDIINSGVIKVIKLNRIFRQALGSRIITNAHRINKGQFPRLYNGKDSDFFFIQEESPDKIIGVIKKLCAYRLPRYYKINPIDDIQVLCPMQRGELGAANLNQVLQQALNPSQVEIRFGSVVYKLNDKVMQIKNNYDKNVFNGDIGRIVKINQEDKNLVIEFNGIQVEYDVTELDEVVLAYAVTIHKSQGSEYRIVIAPIALQHYIMLQRNLVYTCVTRAKEVLILIGSKKALAMAIGNNKITKRNTMLSKRLTELNSQLSHEVQE
ncbi:MAG: ATP-dependent RecD-like DNA helicase [Mahellales bacterium]|jgi:exodeoxyribonuclease V alpha subunit